jgi:hypothetical protein
MRKSLLAVVVGIAMLIPSVAFADSTCGGYSQKTCTTTTTTSTQATSTTTAAATTSADADTDSATTTTTSSGTLPVTGLDVAALLVGASVLLGGGLVIRYLSRNQQS